MAIVRDVDQRMTVPVSIGAGRALSFLIDTGAERSGVASEVAREHRLAPTGSRMVIGFAGRQSISTVHVADLRYARTHRADVEAFLFARDVIGADGFLGVDSLAGQRIDFDFVRQRMAIRVASRSGLNPTPDSVVVRAARREGRLIFANAWVDNVKADIVLDTGSNLTIGNAALRDQLLRRHRLGPTTRVTMIAITGEAILADYGVIKEVMVGDVLIRRLPIAFASVEPFAELGFSDRPAILLGMDALKVFGAVSVDFRSQSVRFVARDFHNRDPATRFIPVG